MEEKLVTRISVLSTLLGGKTTERLLVRISIETHKTSENDSIKFKIDESVLYTSGIYGRGAVSGV